MTDYTTKDVERFWNRVQVDEDDFACWNWDTGLTKAGYGQVMLSGKSRLAHRVAYQLAFGAFDNNLHVLHHCDNRRCCNPNHLFLGTNLDNIKDRVEKNRTVAPKGENCGAHKLTYAEVAEIRQLYALGNTTHRELAQQYNVVHSTIGEIIRRETWE